MNKLLINIKELCGILDDQKAPLAGHQMNKFNTIKDAFLKIKDGKIAEVDRSCSLASGHRVIDASGDLLIPGFVDVHTHIDKGHIWPRKRNPDGTRNGALASTGEDRAAHLTGRGSRVAISPLLRRLSRRGKGSSGVRHPATRASSSPSPRSGAPTMRAFAVIALAPHSTHVALGERPGELDAAVPLAALAGTMLCLVGDIFDFDSVRNLRKVPKTDAAVLVLVTGVTYATNLAVAVFAGVVLSALGFSWKSATRGVTATRTIEPAAYEGRPATVYAIHGPVFFGSVTAFKDALVAAGVLTDGNGDGAGGNTRTDEEIVLDFADARVWDSSALSAVSEAAARLESTGARVHLRHLSPDCARLLERAGDLVEVNVLEDPRYGVLADYPTTAVDTSIEGLARVVPTYRAPAYDVTGAIATQLERSAKRQEEDAKLTPAQKEARMFSYEE